MTKVGMRSQICRIVSQRLLSLLCSAVALLGFFFLSISGYSTEAKGSSLRCSGTFTSDILQPAVVTTLSMTGDFKKAKELSGGGNWTEEERPWDQFGVPVSIAWSSNINGRIQRYSAEALMRVRGKSSADMADFPKLKVKLPKDAPGKNSLFDDLNGFRINTSGFHNEPLAPFREALVYELAEILGMPVPKIRRAYIDYIQKNSDGSLIKVEKESGIIN